MIFSRFSQFKKRAIELHEKEGLSYRKAAKVIAQENEGINAGSLSAYMRQKKWFKGIIPQNLPPSARVLLYDLETSPDLRYSWGKWQAGGSDEMLVRESFLICFSAKWLLEDGIIEHCLTPEEIREGNDSRIVKELHKLLNEADVLIAHNILKFDRPKANTRFIYWGLPPLKPVKMIDTLTHARRQFKIYSNRLDFLGRRFFGIGGKDEMNISDWLACMNGDAETLVKMQKYCSQDVRLLEDVYLKLRAWIQPHPNLALMEPGGVLRCPVCTSENIRIESEYQTLVNVYNSWRCGDCGSVSKSRKNSTPLKVKETLLSPSPKY